MKMKRIAFVLTRLENLFKTFKSNNTLSTDFNGAISSVEISSSKNCQIIAVQCVPTVTKQCLCQDTRYDCSSQMHVYIHMYIHTPIHESVLFVGGGVPRANIPSV